jgi:hypothetical protein
MTFIRFMCTAIAVLFASQVSAAGPKLPERLTSPDGRLEVTVGVYGWSNEPRYSVRLDGKPVLNESHLGLVRRDADFSKGLTLVNASAVTPYNDEY